MEKRKSFELEVSFSPRNVQNECLCAIKMSQKGTVLRFRHLWVNKTQILVLFHFSVFCLITYIILAWAQRCI